MFNLLDYIIALFNKNSENASKNKDLKLILKKMIAKKCKYLSKDRILQQAFANKFFSLYEQVVIVKDFFDKTLFHKDENRRKLFLYFYIDSFLPEEQRKKKDNFEKNLIAKRLRESSNPQKTLENIEHDFAVFRKNYQRENMPEMEVEYNFFYHLYHLINFDFESLFIKMDLSFSPNAPQIPALKDCDATRLSDDLKDFYYTTATLKRITENTNNSIEKLVGRYSEDNLKNTVEKIKNAINTIFKLLQNELSPEVILYMIRYIDSDPYLKIKVTNEHVTILDSYRKEIGNMFTKIKEDALNIFNNESIQNEISDLFKNIQLERIPDYTDDLVVHLDERGLELKGMQAFKVTKTFIKVYEENYKEQINIFLVNGLFNDKEFQRDFSDSYFGVNSLKGENLQTERDFTNNPETSLTTLESLMSTPKSAITEKKIKMLTAEINSIINMHIRHCFSSVHSFAGRMEEILKDYKSQAPQKISNIRSLKGSGTKEFILSMVELYSMMVKYLKLLKRIIPSEEK